VSIETGGRRPQTSYEPPLMTWEEYLPWALANEFPSEWVDGRIVDVWTSTLPHHDVTAYLFKTVNHWVERGQLGLAIFNCLMRLPHRPSGRVPDVMFISNRSMDRLTDTYLDGPADLAIEVVSLDSLKRDRQDKFVEYEAAGVHEYWLIDEPRCDARFYVLGEDGRYREALIDPDGMYRSTVLPGLELPVDQLWRQHDLKLNGAIGTGGGRQSTRYDPPLVSWEDFHAWALTQEHRVEWVDGEIIELPPDSVEHFDQIDFLSDFIKAHVRGGDLGRVFYSTLLMRLPNRPTGRVPDVMFIANEHLNRLTRTYLDGPADLVIEIVSPDSEMRDRFYKLGEYGEARIPEYWLIDKPRQQAHFYVLGDDGKYGEAPVSADGIYTSTVLPGLRIRVEWLWRTRPPTVDEALADLPD
jgi:Uma2 family endonuclease